MAVALKVVGVLLITAMLVIPPAAARPLARTPEAWRWRGGDRRAGGGRGTAARLAFDTPAGPTIVCVAAGIFVLSAGFGALRRAG